MIAIGIILALTAAFVAGLVKYWGKIVEWIKKSVKKIQEVLGICIQGTRTFVKKSFGEVTVNIVKHYDVDRITGEWQETVFEKKVDSEIPPEILAKINNSIIGTEVPTTKEFELVLSH
ncbi:MAG: hypothetical protein DBX61_10110 [Clostridiales bacterium]|nr:MAG: hypothetical protein DBX61_10110 [Clostridiales bacterium]